MIEEVGVITAADSSWVTVTVQRRGGGCGNCGGHNGQCGNAALQMWAAHRQMQLRVPNSLQVDFGEKVVVGVTESSFLHAAVLVYGTLLLTLIGGVYIGPWLLGHHVTTDTELTNLGGGILGLVVGAIWVRYRTGGPRAICQAVLLRRCLGDDTCP